MNKNMYVECEPKRDSIFVYVDNIVYCFKRNNPKSNVQFENFLDFSPSIKIIAKTHKVDIVYVNVIGYGMSIYEELCKFEELNVEKLLYKDYELKTY